MGLTLEQVKEAKQNATKDDLYYIYEDGRGFKQKVANFDHPSICKRTGTIRIESKKINSHKATNMNFSVAYDKRARVTFGIPLDVDDSGKVKWKRFSIPEVKTYNLRNQDEAEEWAIVSRIPEIIHPTLGAYRIYDEDEIAKNEITQARLTQQALSIASDMKLKDYIPALRYLAPEESVENMSAIVIENKVNSIARNTPAKLINYWNSSDRKYYDLFASARAVGLISHDYNNGWLYREKLPLGSTQDAVLEHLSKDPIFAKSLHNEVSGLDVSLQAVLNEKVRGESFDDASSEKVREFNDLIFEANALFIDGTDQMNETQLKTAISLKKKKIAEKDARLGQEANIDSLIESLDDQPKTDNEVFDESLAEFKEPVDELEEPVKAGKPNKKGIW